MKKALPLLFCLLVYSPCLADNTKLLQWCSPEYDIRMSQESENLFKQAEAFSKHTERLMLQANSLYKKKLNSKADALVQTATYTRLEALEAENKALKLKADNLDGFTGQLFECVVKLGRDYYSSPSSTPSH